MRKSFIVIVLLSLSFSSFAQLLFCDHQAAVAAWNAHEKAYQLCSRTGCTILDVEYEGRNQALKTYYKLGKFYKIAP
jgi:hypothetical protein